MTWPYFNVYCNSQMQFLLNSANQLHETQVEMAVITRGTVFTGKHLSEVNLFSSSKIQGGILHVLCSILWYWIVILARE